MNILRDIAYTLLQGEESVLQLGTKRTGLFLTRQGQRGGVLIERLQDTCLQPGTSHIHFKLPYELQQLTHLENKVYFTLGQQY
jgi:hypothetical protein